jgi:hypothetical protein
MIEQATGISVESWLLREVINEPDQADTDLDNAVIAKR